MKLKLLKEQPHLRINTGEFREMFVLRCIYHVGSHTSQLANYSGYSRQFCFAVITKYRKQAMKALRSHIEGFDYEPTVVDQVKTLGRTVARVFEKRKLQNRFANFARKMGMVRRPQGKRA